MDDHDAALEVTIRQIAELLATAYIRLRLQFEPKKDLHLRRHRAFM